jgi:hypothetical protein
LFDDPSMGGDVPPTLERRFGRSAVDVYRRANRGAHAGDAGDLIGLVRNTERVANDLLQLK